MVAIGPDPMEEGKLAAANGEPATANPYPEDSDEHGYWAEGHDHVTGTDEDGEIREDEL